MFSSLKFLIKRFTKSGFLFVFLYFIVSVLIATAGFAILEKRSLLDIIRNRLASIKQDLCNDAARSGFWGDLKARALGQIDWSQEMSIIEKDYCQDDHINIESIERKLSDLDKAYLNTLLQLLSNEQRALWISEVEEVLSPYKNQMDQDSFQQTLELGVKSLLRERLKVRRISLYAT